MSRATDSRSVRTCPSDVPTTGWREEMNPVLAEVERTVCRWDPGK